MTTILDALEAAEKAATRRPWFMNVNDLIGGVLIANVDKPASAIDTRLRRGNTDRVVADMLNNNADTALIVLLRNHAAELIAVAHAARPFAKPSDTTLEQYEALCTALAPLIEEVQE